MCIVILKIVVICLKLIMSKNDMHKNLILYGMLNSYLFRIWARRNFNLIMIIIYVAVCLSIENREKSFSNWHIMKFYLYWNFDLSMSIDT